MFKAEVHSVESYFESFQRGEERGFAFFFETYNLSLNYFARSIVKDTQAAEDIVEDSFIKLWHNRESIIHPCVVKSYLYTAVRNASIDFLRKEKTKSSYEKTMQSVGQSHVDSCLYKIIESETYQLIHLAISELPPKMGRVFQMFYLEEKELKEIAEELNVSVKTVKNQKARALEIIREKLPYLSTLLLFICGNK